MKYKQSLKMKSKMKFKQSFMKKGIPFMLSLIMVFSLIPVAAFANEASEESQVQEQQTSDLPTDLPTDIVTDPPTDNGADQPIDNDAEPPTDNDADPPTDNDADLPTDNDADLPTDNDEDPSTDNGEDLPDDLIPPLGPPVIQDPDIADLPGDLVPPLGPPILRDLDLENLQERQLRISPSDIAASRRMTNVTFTLTGLPDSASPYILQENIILGGFFSNFVVNSFFEQEGAFQISIGTEVELDISAIAPAGSITLVFESTDYGFFMFEGEVDIVFPELVSDTEALEQDEDWIVMQEISLTLKNDSFLRDITAGDLIVSGELNDARLAAFAHSGQHLFFTLIGQNNGEFDRMNIDIPGNLLESGFDLGISFRSGRVPKARQSTHLFVNATGPQTLGIFMAYDSFSENINLSMLNFDSVMSEFTVVDFVRVDHKNIELTLEGGPREAAAGTITFDSAAVISGQAGRVAQITIHESENDIRRPEVIDPPPAEFIAEATLFVAKSLAGAAISYFGTMAIDYLWNYLDEQLGIGEFIGMEPSVEELLGVVIQQLNAMHLTIERNHEAVMSRFDRLEYSIASESLRNTYYSAWRFYDSFIDNVGPNSPLNEEQRERWYQNNFSFGTNSEGERFLGYMKDLLWALDPGRGTAMNYQSLVILFENSAKSQLPFEHNVYTAMYSYLMNWDIEFAKLFNVVLAIYDYHERNQTADYGTVSVATTSLSNLMITTFANIENHLKSQPYYVAYLNVVNTVTMAGYYYPNINTTLLPVVLTKQPEKFMLATNPGRSDDFAYCFRVGEDVNGPDGVLYAITPFPVVNQNTHTWEGISNKLTQEIVYAYVERTSAACLGYWRFSTPRDTDAAGTAYRIATVAWESKTDHPHIATFIHTLNIHPAFGGSNLHDFLEAYLFVFSEDLTRDGELPGDVPVFTVLWDFNNIGFDYLFSGHANFHITVFGSLSDKGDWGRFISLKGPLKSTGERAHQVYNPGKKEFGYNKNFAFLLVEDK